MRYRCFLFDLYGTLVDIRTDEDSPRLWRQASLWFAENGAHYTPAELKRAWHRLCAAEQASSPDPAYEIELRRVFRALYAEKGVRAGRRLTEDTAMQFRIASLRRLKLYPWVLPVFGKLRERGAGLYLLSNAQACFTRPELRALGLESRFDGIVISSEVGVKKPDPRILRTLLDRCGLAAEDCLMIGNEQRCDVAVAHALNMDAFWIRTESSGEYDPALRAELELRDGDFTKIPMLLGL